MRLIFISKLVLKQISYGFCGDVLHKGYYLYYAKVYFEEQEIQLNTMEEDECVLKKGICYFYSFNYYITICKSANAKQSSGNIMGSAENPYLENTNWGW